MMIVQALFLFMLIKAEFACDMPKIRVFKPLETGLVILIALIGNSYALTLPGILILTGLVFSFAGDVALIDQSVRIRFTGGLAAFLIAHILYIVAFAKIVPGYSFTTPSLAAAGVISVCALAIFLLMRPKLGPMTVPVALYIVIISMMVWRSFIVLRYMDPESVFARYRVTFFLGAVLFYISDVILAMNRFFKPMKYNRISLLFYYSGQTLIAVGTLGAGGIFF